VAFQAWPSARRDSPAPLFASSFLAGLTVWPAGALAQWLADPSSAPWREAISSERYLFPARWTWFELLGAFAPIVILFWFSVLARRNGLEDLARVCRRLGFSGGVGVVAGCAVGVIPALLPLVPLEPLRTLHLIYLFLALFSGGFCGELLAADGRRVAAALLLALVLPLAFVMFRAQRAELALSAHCEWPGSAPRNDWLQAFDWIRLNTPRNALFAMNPELLRLPAENEHGFRGLAERSQLAEAAKDRAVSRNIPGLAWAWRDQVHAQKGIEGFTLERLADLRRRYGVTWLLLWKGAERAPAGAALDCPYENASVRVCRAP
jgi:hypothetical protein